MAAPILIAQLSDPHLRMDEPQRAVQFGAAIDRVLALGPVPVAVLVTGDIADNGLAEEYAVAAELLERLPMPVHVLPGNKDDRAGLRAAFDVPGGAGDAPLDYVVDAGPVRLVVGDTLVPGAFGGRLDVDWVAAQLDAAPDQPTVIALHHPPMVIGIPALDAMALDAAARESLAPVLARSPQVLAVVGGHVHRAITSSLGGVPVVTAPSVNFQLAFDPGADAPVVNDDPPAFLIHALVGNRLASHVQSVARV